MKSILAFLVLLLPFCVSATHLSGGEITYKVVPGSRGLKYEVTLVVYRDCSGITLGSETINLSVGRCGPTVSGAVGTGPISPSKRDTLDIFSSRYPAMYKCSGNLVNPADPFPVPNFEIVTYVTTITLPYYRSNWCFWWNSGARPDLANVSITVSGEYLDAILNNSNLVENSTPRFTSLNESIIYAPYNQLKSVSYWATDPDGDSLAYSFLKPLGDCSTAVVYNNMPNGVLDSTSFPGTTIPLNFGNTSYSSTNPLLSYSSISLTGTVASPNTFFSLNPRTGTLMFWPRYYKPNTPLGSGDNKYVMAIRIDEYRRVNGRMTIVGSIERDVLIVVYVNGNTDPLTIARAMPVISAANPSATVTAVDETTFDIGIPENTENTYSFTCANPTGTALAIFPATSANSYYPIEVQNNRTPAAKLTVKVNSFMPAPQGTYSYSARFMDDNYPVRNSIVLNFNLHVIPNTKAPSVLAEKAILCPAKELVLKASPSITQVNWNNGVAGNDNTISQVGTYYFTGRDPIQGLTRSKDYVVTADSALAPTVAISKNTLVSPYAPGIAYQWLLNGNPVPNATSNTLAANEDGTYGLVVTSVGGCQYVAPESKLTYFSIINRPLSISPNPVSNSVTVKGPLSMWQACESISLTDVFGRTVATMATMPTADGIQSLDLSRVPRGTYYLNLRGTDVRQKVVKE